MCIKLCHAVLISMSIHRHSITHNAIETLDRKDETDKNEIRKNPLS
jgi:hypothetical protein